MELDIKQSITRLAYLKARIEGSLVSNNSYRSSLSPSLSGRTILANLSIGQPPIPQLLIMDTGSRTFWTMCTPCTSCTQYPGQIFNPSKSSTYSPSCREPCYFDEYCKCEPLTYSISYADYSFSSGTIGSDMLTFETGDEGITRLTDIEFGCAHDIIYNRDPCYNGVLGLGFNSESVSLVTQIGPKFSYCLGSLSDKYYNYNHLILGEGANLEGYTTHFVVHNGYNYVTMEGISIGENCLDVDPSAFEMKENGTTGGVIIDTGSPFSYFADDVYKLLYNEIKNLFQGSLRQVRARNYPWMLCYAGSISKDLTGFPVVTFHFAGGADLVLDSSSFFQQRDNFFCMTVAPTSQFGIDLSVIGLLAQQSYNVGYDQVNGLIYFQRIDCELLSS
ncbi:hypothetical protein TSUD_375760 [Trifolium subterraneum]|uniref:Peptidase A1 domain-containing protein n=1 Tax=Trifolium subterraneum TaxID=3900 RepID=A0A2Z6MJ37_TRISU|nr:hypothetical protein TSUD_375760 [Trifolium subterraneum]